MYFKVCLIASALLCIRYCAKAATVEELKLMYMNYILECAKDYPISTDDILAMKKHEIQQTQNVKCLLACTYKKSGMKEVLNTARRKGYPMQKMCHFHNTYRKRANNNPFWQWGKKDEHYIFKETHTDDEGKLSVEGIRTLANDVFAEDPELRKKSEAFAEACKFVNDEEITGDKKECERAAMIFKCSVDNAANIN